MITDNDIRQAPKISMKNSVAVEMAQQCGCYHCLAVFSKTDIQDWTDQNRTALCPKCKVDAVIPDGCGIEINEENMKAIHDFWV